LQIGWLVLRVLCQQRLRNVPLLNALFLALVLTRNPCRQTLDRCHIQSASRCITVGMRVAIYAFQPTNKIPTINSSSYVNATRARNSSSLRGTHPSNVRFRVALFQHPRLFTTDAVIVESQRETRCMSVHATIKEQVNPGLRRTAGWCPGEGAFCRRRIPTPRIV